MPPHDSGSHSDYDRLYYRLDLEPGASAAEITRKYRQLAQILHPDKWRHASPAQQHWANEQFKSVKHAREVLELYWHEHHAAPASRSAMNRAQVDALRDAARQLQALHERLRGEIAVLQTEKARAFGEFLHMKGEREGLRTELASLREQAARTRIDAAHLREQITADASHPLETAQQRHGTLSQRLFAHLDDPKHGWMLYLGAIFMAFVSIHMAAHRIVAVLFEPVDLSGDWRWMADFVQWVLVIGGAVLVYGNGWALYALHRAERAGQQRLLPMSADQAWHCVTVALHAEGYGGGAWSFASCEVQPGDSALELRAVLRFSPRAKGAANCGAADGACRYAVTFRCCARAVGAAQTRLGYAFDVAAPFWWRVPAARAVSGLCRRIETNVGAR